MQQDQNRYSIHSMELGPMENFIYLIHDHASNTAAIVDPAWEVNEMLDFADSRDIKITDILLTHSHHDHINGLQQTLEHSDARVHLLKPEAKFWGANLSKPVLHHGAEQIKIGDSQVNILHTPGHTPGSACYQVGDDLIAVSRRRVGAQGDGHVGQRGLGGVGEDDRGARAPGVPVGKGKLVKGQRRIGAQTLTEEDLVGVAGADLAIAVDIGQRHGEGPACSRCAWRMAPG